MTNAFMTLPIIQALPAGLEERERMVIAWSAIGIPAHIIGERVGCKERWVFRLQVRLRVHIDALRPIARGIAADMFSSLAMQYAEIGLRALDHIRKHADKMGTRECMDLAKCCETYLGMSQALAGSQIRDDARRLGAPSGLDKRQMDAANASLRRLSQAAGG